MSDSVMRNKEKQHSVQEKIQKILVVLLAVCLTGCSFMDTASEPHGQADTTQAEEFNSTEMTEATTELPALPETHASTTAPTETQEIPLQEIEQPEPNDEDFVKVETYIPDICIDLRYASENNFTAQKIYEFHTLWLRYGTVKKLIQVQEELEQQGLGLKIWDGFRPTSAQFELWDICPDPTFVSDPNKGFSSHSRGNTVDVTLVYADGTEVIMPTGFDDFSKLADRDFSDCSQDAAFNASLLEQIMKKHGFKPYSGEWWHYTDEQSYPVEQIFEPVEAAWYYADCNEYISLRTRPGTDESVITKISVGEAFLVVANHGEFSLIEYHNLFGYVLNSYIKPVGG